MNKRIGSILTAGALTLVSSAALALEPLEVVLTDGCPTSVVSNQESCTPGQPDPVNEACQTNNGAVRWDSDKPILSISLKTGSTGMQNCQQLPVGFQCVVVGSPGDRIGYSVKLVDPNCAELDPVIIIK